MNADSKLANYRQSYPNLRKKLETSKTRPVTVSGYDVKSLINRFENQILDSTNVTYSENKIYETRDKRFSESSLSSDNVKSMGKTSSGRLDDTVVLNKNNVNKFMFLQSGCDSHDSNRLSQRSSSKSVVDSELVQTSASLNACNRSLRIDESKHLAKKIVSSTTNVRNPYQRSVSLSAVLEKQERGKDFFRTLGNDLSVKKTNKNLVKIDSANKTKFVSNIKDDSDTGLTSLRLNERETKRTVKQYARQNSDHSLKIKPVKKRTELERFEDMVEKCDTRLSTITSCESIDGEDKNKLKEVENIENKSERKTSIVRSRINSFESQNDEVPLRSGNQNGAITKQKYSSLRKNRVRNKSYILATRSDSASAADENLKNLNINYVAKTASKFENPRTAGKSDSTVLAVVDLSEKEVSTELKTSIKTVLEKYKKLDKDNKKLLHQDLDKILSTKTKTEIDNRTQSTANNLLMNAKKHNTQNINVENVTNDSHENGNLMVVIHNTDDNNATTNYLNLTETYSNNPTTPDYLIIVQDNAAIISAEAGNERAEKNSNNHLESRKNQIINNSDIDSDDEVCYKEMKQLLQSDAEWKKNSYEDLLEKTLESEIEANVTKKTNIDEPIYNNPTETRNTTYLEQLSPSPSSQGKKTFPEKRELNQDEEKVNKRERTYSEAYSQTSTLPAHCEEYIELSTEVNAKKYVIKKNVTEGQPADRNAAAVNAAIMYHREMRYENLDTSTSCSSSEEEMTDISTILSTNLDKYGEAGRTAGVDIEEVIYANLEDLLKYQVIETDDTSQCLTITSASPINFDEYVKIRRSSVEVREDVLYTNLRDRRRIKFGGNNNLKCLSAEAELAYIDSVERNKNIFRQDKLPNSATPILNDGYIEIEFERNQKDSEIYPHTEVIKSFMYSDTLPQSSIPAEDHKLHMNAEECIEEQKRQMTNTEKRKSRLYTSQTPEYNDKCSGDSNKVPKRTSRLYSGSFYQKPTASNIVKGEQDKNNNKLQAPAVKDDDLLLLKNIENFTVDSEGPSSLDTSHGSSSLDEENELNNNIVEAYNPVMLNRREYHTAEWVHAENWNGFKDNESTIRRNSRRKRENKDAWHAQGNSENGDYDLKSNNFFTIDLMVTQQLKICDEVAASEVNGITNNTEDRREPVKISRRQGLMNELITTEKNYIEKSLYRIVKEYMPEMNNNDLPSELTGKLRNIFGNIDFIYEQHSIKFLPALKSCKSIDSLAECFLRHESMFKLYPLYSKNKPKSDLVMKEHGQYFKKKQAELGDRLDLASYLLKPIQRLGQYCLLMKSLVRECAKENMDNKKLVRATEMLQKQMSMGNDLIATDSIINCNLNLKELGELILRDTFTVTPPNKKVQFEGMVFLYEETILITQVLRQNTSEFFNYKDDIRVTDMGRTKMEHDQCTFRVWYRRHDQKTYTLKAKNDQIKQKWVAEIDKLLWPQLEANRIRMKKEQEKQSLRTPEVLARGTQGPSLGPNKKRKPSTSKSFMKSKPDTTWYDVRGEADDDQI